MTNRTATLSRKTSETDISIRLSLDGNGTSDISTGIHFLDHMLDALCRHARIELSLTCRGDLDVDDHHTVEDCGIVLGEAISTSLGDRAGIERFGYAYAPLDEALCRAVVDISGRPSAHIDLGLTRDRLGALSCENIPHFFQTLATHAGITLHLDVLKGENDHHRAEAAFKAFSLALRRAISLSGYGDIASTKGTIDQKGMSKSDVRTQESTADSVSNGKRS